MRLNQEIERVISSDDAKEKLFNAGIETVGGAPELLTTMMKSEINRMGKVIKDAGIRGQ
jgi:tripartite-type tricarboxylate transporter receptor subunit TctC